MYLLGASILDNHQLVKLMGQAAISSEHINEISFLVPLALGTD